MENKKKRRLIIKTRREGANRELNFYKGVAWSLIYFFFFLKWIKFSVENTRIQRDTFHQFVFNLLFVSGKKKMMTRTTTTTQKKILDKGTEIFIEIYANEEADSLIVCAKKSRPKNLCFIYTIIMEHITIWWH